MSIPILKAAYGNPFEIRELLENLEEPEFREMTFKRVEKGLEVHCVFEQDEETLKGYYLYNKQGVLQLVVLVEDGEESIIFDRKEEIKKLRLRFRKKAIMKTTIN